MKVQTDHGEQEIEEVIRCYNLWRNLIVKNVERRNEFHKTEEGKQQNRANSKNYYQRHREEILEKRRIKYASRQTQNEE